MEHDSAIDRYRSTGARRNAQQMRPAGTDPQVFHFKFNLNDGRLVSRGAFDSTILPIATETVISGAAVCRLVKRNGAFWFVTAFTSSHSSLSNGFAVCGLLAAVTPSKSSKDRETCDEFARSLASRTTQTCIYELVDGTGWSGWRWCESWTRTLGIYVVEKFIGFRFPYCRPVLPLPDITYASDTDASSDTSTSVNTPLRVENFLCSPSKLKQV